MKNEEGRMKTLDEVIDMVQDAIDHTDAECPMMCLFEGDATDILDYLKDYKSITDICNKHEIKSIYELLLSDPEKASEQVNYHGIENDDNPALTWNELKKMVGKPVWLERPEWKEWLLISEMDKETGEMYLRDKWGNGASVNVRNVGYWRAFRKERE